MTFRDVLEGIHRDDPAVVAGALLGSDGLVVEEWALVGTFTDISALSAEAAHLFRVAGRISSENGLGRGADLLLAGDAGIMMIRSVNDEYLLLLRAAPNAIPGKCRFLLRRAAASIREIL